MKDLVTKKKNINLKLSSLVINVVKLTRKSRLKRERPGAFTISHFIRLTISAKSLYDLGQVLI